MEGEKPTLEDLERHLVRLQELMIETEGLIKQVDELLEDAKRGVI